MKALVAADAFAALLTYIWFSLFRMMADHYAMLPRYGYSGKWDFWVYFPLAMTLGLLASIAVFTLVTRRPGTTALIAVAALLPILPYGMMIGGGV